MNPLLLYLSNFLLLLFFCVLVRSRSHDSYDFFPVLFFNPLHMDALSDDVVDKCLLLSSFSGLLASRMGDIFH